MSEKSLSENHNLCTVAWIHFKCWQVLLEQINPVANKHEINNAYKLYLFHIENCNTCIQLKKDINGF